MKKYIPALLISLFFGVQFLSGINLHAQPGNLDSLWTVANDQSVDDSSRVKAMIGYCLSIRFFAPDSAISLLYQYKELAESLENSQWKGILYIALGLSYLHKHELKLAEDFFLQSLPIQIQRKDSFRLGGLKVNLGNVYSEMGKYDLALSYYQEALDVLEPINHKPYIRNALANIGAVYASQGLYPQALDLFLKFIKITTDPGFEEGEIGRSDLFGMYMNISEVHKQMGNKEEAREYLIKGLNLSENNGDSAAFFIINDRLVELLMLEDTASSIPYYKQKVQRASQAGDHYGVSSSLLKLGHIAFHFEKWADARKYYQESAEILIKIGKMSEFPAIANQVGNSYLKLSDYAQAIVWCRKGLDQTILTNQYQAQKDGCNCLYQAYKAQGDKTQALANLEKVLILQDSIFNQEQVKKVTQQSLEFQFNQQQIADSVAFVQQQATIDIAHQKQLSSRNYLLFGGLGLALLAFIFFRYRQQLKTREQELQLQRERERKEQLAELDSMKSRFFANISHEFRTPLTLILGQNEQLQFESEKPENLSKYDMVDRNGRRLLELINQVLDLSKIESGKLGLTYQQTDLIPFLKNLFFSFESLADQKTISLHFENHQEELWAIIDPEKMERIMFNLISNAIKFTPEQGRITIKVSSVEDHVNIQVLDTGAGISEDDLPYIFDRFYQVEGANAVSSGTGIGLALVKELVDMHQGDISVSSKPNEGSTFTLNLPVKPEGEITQIPPETFASQVYPTPSQLMKEAETAVIASETIGEVERVLIVEDNPDVRTYLHEQLAGFGYQVIEAEDGLIGLEQARTHLPDLIISDVMMPNLDGMGFAKEVRQDERTSHIPLILLTAKASEESRITGLETGVDDYLVKPFNRRELKARVANLIQQRKQLQQKFSTSLQIKPSEVSAVPMDQVFLQKVIDTIEENMGNEQLDLTMLSEAVGMSITHLNRKLNALIGQSGAKMIRSMRMQRAADLLQNQAMTVAEAAFAVGFSEPTNFSRNFKKQFGVAPSEYGGK
ncbi:MAG: tetratricopeptide repeat protein [Bacteroidia bacterium]